eukprot:gene4503-5100_t
MSLFKYFDRVPKEKVAISAAESGLSERETQSVEVEITKAASTSTKKKRSKYGDYDEFKRAELAKWGIVHGIRPTARKFSIPESTVRSMIKSYNESTKSFGPHDLEILPKKRRGAKTLAPEEIDKKVLAMIQSMRASGTAVDFNMTVSIARGITLANDRTLLKENGGHIDFSKSWAQSILRRLGYSKRKATTSKAPIAPGLLKEVGTLGWTDDLKIKWIKSAFPAEVEELLFDANDEDFYGEEDESEEDEEAD